MIVGIHWAGDGRYGPLPSGAGTHDGMRITGLLGDARHGASLPESQPQPLPFPPVVPGVGLMPRKPSICEATRSMCPPQLPAKSLSNVRSDTAKVLAAAARFGI